VGKIAFIITGVFLTSFAMGRVESLTAHRGFSGSIAFAQQWDDSFGSADIDSQPDKTVPDVSGSYTGTVQDHKLGTGDISADIIQNGSRLTGDWDSDFGGPGTINGRVKPNGKVHLRLKITGARGCGLNAQGVFRGGDEIVGKYQVTGCKKSDHGTFDIFD
jgi:hypothetical protein